MNETRPLRHSRRGLATLLLLLAMSSGCDYARMTDDEAVNTYRSKLPPMPPHTVPVGGGIEELRTANPRELVNPLPATPAVVDQGRTAYGYFCFPCHGPKADGLGTVGQSFAPLPADLAAAAVRDQRDGELFVKTSLGFKRCPPLAQTVAERDRWAILHYLRTLPQRPRQAGP